jgi:5-bromo-4-chloroindolyl phosphate hydrolysis protein
VADSSTLTSISQIRDRLPVVGPLLLYVLPVPLFPSVFIALARGNFVNFAVTLSALMLLMGAGWLTRRGQQRDVQMQRLGWSRVPLYPWKTGGAIAAGTATALCSLIIIKHSPATSASIGLFTLAGVLLSYGLDGYSLRFPKKTPLASKDKEVAAALEEARLKITLIDQANQQIHNAELNRRIRRINAKAMEILSTIADDPATLRRARKFLKVYLDGTQRVTEGYSRIHQDQRDVKLDDNFRNALTTIEDTFNEQYRKLQEKDAMDLDIQIEVLTTQLKNEGVI